MCVGSSGSCAIAGLVLRLAAALQVRVGEVQAVLVDAHVAAAVRRAARQRAALLFCALLPRAGVRGQPCAPFDSRRGEAWTSVAVERRQRGELRRAGGRRRPAGAEPRQGARHAPSTISVSAGNRKRRTALLRVEDAANQTPEAGPPHGASEAQPPAARTDAAAVRSLTGSMNHRAHLGPLQEQAPVPRSPKSAPAATGATGARNRVRAAVARPG